MKLKCKYVHTRFPYRICNQPAHIVLYKKKKYILCMRHEEYLIETKRATTKIFNPVPIKKGDKNLLKCT